MSAFLLTSPVVARTTLYIDSSNGNDEFAGTITQPWKTIERAFNTSKTPYLRGGDTLYLRGGLYRFDQGKIGSNGNVQGNQISGSAGAPTVISGYPGEKVSIYLSARIDSGWQKFAGRPGANIWFFDWASYLQANHPWLAQNTNGIPQLVNRDGNPPQVFQEVNSAKNAPEPTYIASVRTDQNDMIAGDFYYESDAINADFGKLFLWLPDGSDPNGQPLEVGLNPAISLIYQHHLTISDLSIRYANGGSLNFSGTDNIFDSLDVSYNGFYGLIGQCQSCVVRDSTLSHNGNEGSILEGENTLYENNMLEGNNYRRYSAAWHCGGMKLIPGIRSMTIRGNTFKNTVACPGLWFDGMKDNHLIEKNMFISDDLSGLSSGLMLEVSNGTAEHPTIVRNNIFDGPGVYVAGSSYIYIFNNLFTNRGVTLHGVDPNSDSSRWTVSNNKVINNIFYFPAGGFPLPVFIVLGTQPPINASNNVSDHNVFFTADGAPLVFGGDLGWNNGISLSNWLAKGFDTHSLAANPLLQNVAAKNFIPESNSPIVGAGIPTSYVTDDILGRLRIGGNDIGPYDLSSPRVVPPASGASFLPFKNVFNPLKESMTIKFLLADETGGNVTVTIYDRQGNGVRILDKASATQATWDGKNSQGSYVASGTYLVVLKYGEKVQKKKVVVVK